MFNVRRAIVLLGVLLLSSAAYAGSNTRSAEADQIVSSDKTKTFTLPSASDTLCGIGASQALTNKTIDGSQNTITNVSATINYVQEAPTGSGTSYALSFTPTSNGSVVLTLDGLVLTQGSGKEYTLSGTNITMGTAPATGQTLWAVYTK